MSNTALLSLLAAMACCLVAQSASAVEAACKPIRDAADKMARTPYHAVSTVDGKPFEKVYTTTHLYIRSDRRWLATAMTPQEVLDAMRESGRTISNCRQLRTETVDGQRTTVYAFRSRYSTAAIQDEEDMIWVGGNGLTLKSVTDVKVNGRMSHAESHITFGNVQPPAGVH